MTHVIETHINRPVYTYCNFNDYRPLLNRFIISFCVSRLKSETDLKLARIKSGTSIPVSALECLKKFYFKNTFIKKIILQLVKFIS